MKVCVEITALSFFRFTLPSLGKEYSEEWSSKTEGSLLSERLWVHREAGSKIQEFLHCPSLSLASWQELSEVRI